MTWHFAEHLASVLWARLERAFGTHVRPSRRVWPRTRSGPWPTAASTPCILLHCHATPTTLAPYSAAVRALLAARRRPQRASATVGAAKPLPLASSPLEQCPLVR